MKQFIITFIIFFLLVSKNSTAQTNWKIKNSKISFKIKNAGFNVAGSLQGLEGKILFSPESVSSSIFDVTIDAKSIDTDNNTRDNHLRKEEYFYVEKYPKIVMKSKRIEKKGSDEFIAYFDLTIRDKTKEISFPFQFKESKETTSFIGNFSINRRDYGVGSGSFILSDNVNITLNILTNK